MRSNIFFRSIYYVFMALVLLVAILLIVPILPIPGNYQIRVVLSGSMEPAIKTGSIVAVKPASKYVVGDVITYSKPSFKDSTGHIIPVSHRILEIKSDGTYITKGDANNVSDPDPVRKSEVIGKVILTVPYIGYAVQTARQPYGLIILIVIPAAILIVDQIKKIWTEVGRIRREKSDSTNP